MDKKGQTLVVFVLMIPLFMILAAFIVDNSMIINKNLHLKNVTKDIIRNNLSNKEMENEQIVKLFNKNDIPTEELEINKDDISMTIKNHYFVESIFGKIVGINSYELEINITGVLKNNKVIFE